MATSALSANAIVGQLSKQHVAAVFCTISNTDTIFDTSLYSTGSFIWTNAQSFSGKGKNVRRVCHRAAPLWGVVKKLTLSKLLKQTFWSVRHRIFCVLNCVLGSAESEVIGYQLNISASKKGHNGNLDGLFINIGLAGFLEANGLWKHWHGINSSRCFHRLVFWTAVHCNSNKNFH